MSFTAARQNGGADVQQLQEKVEKRFP